MSNHSVKVRKEDEIEMAWKQHKGIDKIPSKERVFEMEERKRRRGRWH
jgi:hypothetical protein